MGLFNRKKKTDAGDLSAKVYAFIGLGMMARFMNEDQLKRFVNSLPAVFGREVGAEPGDVIVVHSKDWADGNDMANAINFDGTPAAPGLGERLCEEYLRNKGIHNHAVGDIMFYGVMNGDSVAMGTLDELKGRGVDVNGATILVTAYFAFHISRFQ